MNEMRKAKPGEDSLTARVRAAARQEQFLDVVSAEDARTRFAKHLDLSPLGDETVLLQNTSRKIRPPAGPARVRVGGRASVQPLHCRRLRAARRRCARCQRLLANGLSADCRSD